MAVTDPVDGRSGKVLIDAIDEAGYMREDAAEIADRLGVPKARVERVLKLIQTFDPAGIGARDLAECLAIQLRKRDDLIRPCRP